MDVDRIHGERGSSIMYLGSVCGGRGTSSAANRPPIEPRLCPLFDTGGQCRYSSITLRVTEVLVIGFHFIPVLGLEICC